MADVFISYKKEDRDLVERVSAALAQRNISVWWDASLRGGALFRSAISEELKKAKAVVVIWSKRSVLSDWVLDEADYAKGYNKLIPVRFASDFDVPLGFRQLQVEDLSAWSGDAAAPQFHRMVEQIQAVSGQRFDLFAQVVSTGVRLHPVADAAVSSALGGAAKIGASLANSFAHATLLGIPLHRFATRGLAAGAFLSAALAFLQIDSNVPLAARLVAGAIVALPFCYVVRALHQFVMFKKGLGSRRFFDPIFRFWAALSAILAVIGAALTVDVTDPAEIFSNIAAAVPRWFMIVLGGLTLARATLSLFRAPAPEVVGVEQP